MANEPNTTANIPIPLKRLFSLVLNIEIWYVLWLMLWRARNVFYCEWSADGKIRFIALFFKQPGHTIQLCVHANARITHSCGTLNEKKLVLWWPHSSNISDAFTWLTAACHSYKFNNDLIRFDFIGFCWHFRLVDC